MPRADSLATHRARPSEIPMDPLGAVSGLLGGADLFVCGLRVSLRQRCCRSKF